MESVASRAKTGVAVLYRRWANKDDLVLAAIRYYGQQHPVAMPDTGSLREDLRILLRNVSNARLGFVAITTATFAGLHDSAGLAPRDIRLSVIGGTPMRSHPIFLHAAERGEIDLERIPQDVLELPFQLMRHDMIMNLAPATDERLRSIVDDIAWPLFQRYGQSHS
jgi:AcrR family transcriptional regulator